MKKIVMLVLTVSILVFSFNTCFASVDDETLEVIRVLGIMNGDQNGNLNLSNKVTRAEFVKMLICASVYKDKVPTVSYYSPYSDVPYTHWSSGYIQLAVEQGWVNGYTDGTFRPDNTINLEEAVILILSILGYTSQDVIGTYPYGQLALYNSLGLNKNIIAKQGTQLSRQDCVYLFYNMLSANTKSGVKYLQMLGYTADTNGNVDINKVINENVDGPYVVTSTIYEMGIDLSNITVERNSYKSTLEDISKYDVIYYSDKLNKIWAYSKAITGTYLSATPSTTSPSSVNIGGNTYSLETSQATYALSSNGQYKVGDVVTALIGREGIVKVLNSEEFSLTLYGVVKATSIETYVAANGNEYSSKTVTIYGTDGNTYKVKNRSEYKEYEIGQIVEVSYTNGNPVITNKSTKSVSGKVTNRYIGDTKLADNINILDVHGENVMKIYLSRLLESTLTKNSVLFYATNESGEITDLILNNFTGDLNKYVIFTNVDESGDSGIYTYVYGNKTENDYANGVVFGVKKGVGYIEKVDGNIVRAGSLKELGKVSKISGNTVTAKSNTMYIADNAMIYYKDGADYITTSLNELVNNFDEYNSITAYYDDTTLNGGRVRVIIAQ